MRSFSKRRRRSFPELKFFSSDEERRNAWRQAMQAMRAAHLSRVGVVATGLALFALVIAIGYAEYVGRLLERSIHLPSNVFQVFVPAAFAFSASGIHIWLYQRTIHDSLRRQLVERGIPICIKCGYDLRGQTKPRCPECGGPFDPALLSATGE